MRWVVIIVAALMILGVAASGLILAQKGSTPTATAASTVYTASVTQEVSALPTRAPVSQIAQATGSEASPLILQANVEAQSGSPMTTVTQAPSAAAAAPNVKDQSPSTISKAMVHETTRLKDDATGWAHKLQGLELDLKLQLDLKNNQDVEATGKDVNECLVVLRAAAGRLAPDAETRVTLRKQEVAVRDLAIRAEVHPTFSAGQITSSYIPANATSGTLFVSSGGTLVAAIKMAGSYSAGDFHITAGPFNTVLITDPPVVSSNVVGSSAGSDGPRSAAVSNFIQTIEVLSA